MLPSQQADEVTAAAAAAAFARVTEPLRIGGLEIRNRIVLPAMTTNYGDDHLPSAQHAAYHEERAAGGVGLIIFESIRVHANSLGRPQGVNGFDPECVDPFREIVRRVHAHGARIFGQVIHLGRQIDGDFEGTVSWGASPIAWTATAVAPHEMTEDDMDVVVEGHLATTRNLLAAGFDGIELQMAHGHLLQQFISPLSNRRTDQFGGTLGNRMRFPARVLAALRAEVGPDVPLGVRLGAAEFVPGGLEVEEAAEVAVALASATQIDFVNVSHSAYHGSPSLGTQMADMNFTDVDQFRALPRQVRATLQQAGHRIPVFAVCKFTSLEEAEQALADGVADAVAMARAHLADPQIVVKSLSGRSDSVRRCIGCNQGCVAMLEKNLPIRCLVNPRTGRESDPTWLPSPVVRPRRLVVVGGGPAGMECAAVAAGRGHEVHLWERGSSLGGMLAHAPRMPRREAFGSLLASQAAALTSAGVKVSVGIEADVASLLDSASDEVVLATGACLVVPEILGGGRVLGLLETLDAIDDEEANGPSQFSLGRSVAVIDLTGDWPALALVERLADLGKEVTLYCQVAAYAWRTTIYSTLATSGRLKEKKVRIRTLTEVARWDGTEVTLLDRSTGEVDGKRAHDSVVHLVHPVTDNRLYDALRGAGLATRQIGDALAPRTALEAVHQGHRAGLDL